MSDAKNANDEQRGQSDFEEIMRGRELLGEAKERTPGDDPTEWLQGVRHAARELFRIIESHQGSSEDEGGTLSNLTARKPGLMHDRQRLEHEHADMLHRLVEIDVETERQIASHDYNIDLVRLQVRVLRDILLLHLTRTYSLLYEAYVRVEGGEG